MLRPVGPWSVPWRRGALDPAALPAGGHDVGAPQLEPGAGEGQDRGPAHGLAGSQRVEDAQVAGARHGWRARVVVEAEADGVDVGVERGDAALVRADAAEGDQVH